VGVVLEGNRFTANASRPLMPGPSSPLSARKVRDLLDARPDLRIWDRRPHQRSFRTGPRRYRGCTHAGNIDVVTKLAPIQGYIVVRAGHPLTTRAPFNLANVLEYPFAQVVMLPPRLLKPILASRRLAAPRSGTPSVPFPAVECPTLRLATDIVASSDAFTFATLGMVRAELEQRLVVPLLHEPWMHSEWAIFRLRKRTMSPAMTAFVEELERTHREVLCEEERLRERWFRPGVGVLFVLGVTVSLPTPKEFRGLRPLRGPRVLAVIFPGRIPRLFKVWVANS